ncbi:MAG: hypothetical protein WKF88_09835 [Ferruginibacter sp.]
MSKVFRTLTYVLHEKKTTVKNYLIVLLVAILFVIFPRHTTAKTGAFTIPAPGTGSFHSDRNNNVINLTPVPQLF